MSKGAGVSPVIIGTLARIATAAMDTAVSLQRILPSLTRPVAQPMGINFVATNVPGSQVPLYLAGHRMIDYVGLLPLGANLGFGVPIVSYNQNLYFTMMAEPNLMPDPDCMKSLVEQVFEELKQAAIAKSVPEPAKPRVKRLKHASSTSSSGLTRHIQGSPRRAPIDGRRARRRLPQTRIIRGGV